MSPHSTQEYVEEGEEEKTEEKEEEEERACLKRIHAVRNVMIEQNIIVGSNMRTQARMGLEGGVEK